MGRPKKEVDTEVLYDLLEKGTNKKDIACDLGMDAGTLSKRIVDIQEKQGLILQYRSLQNIQLTEIQALILEHVTPDKIEQAPLRDLIFAYKILKDKELVAVGKPTDIKGMMHYLIELERREIAGGEPPKMITETEGNEEDEDVIEITQDGVVNVNDLNKTMPNL